MYIPLKGDEVKFTFTQPLVMWNRCIVREGRFELKFTGRSLQFLLFMRTVLGFYTVINPDPFLYEKIGSSSIHELWNLTDHGLDIGGLREQEVCIKITFVNERIDRNMERNFTFVLKDIRNKLGMRSFVNRIVQM